MDVNASEANWNKLLECVRDINAMRILEATEKTCLGGPHDQIARRMLDIIAVKKLAVEVELGKLIDVVATDPYWDSQIESLDRELLAAKVRMYGGN